MDISTDDRPGVYIEESGLVVYRASALGMCVKALVALGKGGYEEVIGEERLSLLNRTANEGHIHEEAMRQKLVKEGWKIISTQELAQVEIMNGVVVRGHTDGVMEPENVDGYDEQHLVEFKSMSNKRFDRWVRQGFFEFVKYAYQISMYMKANPGLPALYIAKRREDGYEYRQTIPADKPPIPWKDIRRKVMVAESFRRRRGAFPPCDVDSKEMFWCPMWYLHDEADDQDGDYTMTDEARAIIEDLLPQRFELKELEDDGKVAEEKRKRLDKEILNLMGKTDSAEVEVDDQWFRISRVNGGGSNLDQTKLRADMGEDILPYEKHYRFSYPRVTAIKKPVKKGTTE